MERRASAPSKQDRTHEVLVLAGLGAEQPLHRDAPLNVRPPLPPGSQQQGLQGRSFVVGLFSHAGRSNGLVNQFLSKLTATTPQTKYRPYSRSYRASSLSV